LQLASIFAKQMLAAVKGILRHCEADQGNDQNKLFVIAPETGEAHPLENASEPVVAAQA